MPSRQPRTGRIDPDDGGALAMALPGLAEARALDLTNLPTRALPALIGVLTRILAERGEDEAEFDDHRAQAERHVRESEEHLAQAERHVREGEERIRRMATLVGELETDGQAEATGQAEQTVLLLATMQETLKPAREHVPRLREVHGLTR